MKAALKCPWESVRLAKLFALIASVALSALAGCATRTSPNKPASFYFVQISDTHFGDKEEHFARAQKVVEAVNSLKEPIEFVILTGDISDGKIADVAVMEKGKKILAGLKYPLHCVPGNCDIYGNAEKMTLRTEKYREQFGEACQKFSVNGVNFLSLDVERYRREIHISKPELWPAANREELKSKELAPDTAAAKARLDQIDELFQSMKGEPIIIFQHIPPVSRKYEGYIFPDWPQELEDLWKKYLTENNVLAILTGHFHADAHQWLGNVPIYTCPAICEAHPAYRLFEYKDGRLSYWTKTIND
jgi:predicted MPP superfamily phosphohydrolase